jgi:uncharacterized protein (DUF3084 family)
MLALIYGELRDVKTELRDVKTKMEVVETQNARLETELGATRGELQTVKRRLEEKEAEEQNKRGCSEYYFLEIRTRLDRRPTGVRATIYELADHHNALQYTKHPFFCTEQNGTVLIMNLYFPLLRTHADL